MVITNSSDRLLLACIKSYFLQQELTVIEIQLKSVTDWNHLLNCAIKNGIAPLLYHTLSKFQFKTDIPPAVLEELQKLYYTNLSRNTVLYHEFKALISALQDKGIEVVALKGIYLAEKLYEDIALRILSDIDILVHTDKVQEASTILIDNGFKSSNHAIKTSRYYDLIETKHVPTLFKNGISVEIHKSTVINDDFYIPLEDFWKHTISSTISEAKLLVFDIYYQLLHICMHLDEHFIDGRLHFIAYVDLCWLLDKNKTAMDWTIFDEMCERYQCVSSVYPHLYIASTYLHASLPDFIWRKAETCSTQYYEEFFVNSLQTNPHFTPLKKNRNILELKKAKGIQSRLHLLMDDIFPSKSFMVYRYKIKNSNSYYCYYVVRLFGGVLSLFKYLFRIK